MYSRRVIVVNDLLAVHYPLHTLVAPIQCMEQTTTSLSETDQAVGEGEGMFGQQLHHVRVALLCLIGEPGTPHVLM